MNLYSANFYFVCLVAIPSSATITTLYLGIVDILYSVHIVQVGTALTLTSLLLFRVPQRIHLTKGKWVPFLTFGHLFRRVMLPEMEILEVIFPPFSEVALLWEKNEANIDTKTERERERECLMPSYITTLYLGYFFCEITKGILLINTNIKE